MEWKPVSIFMLVIGVFAAMALGDYLGYKFRAGRVGIYLGIAIIVTIVAFAVYAVTILI
jgi:hypothetical protein